MSDEKSFSVSRNVAAFSCCTKEMGLFDNVHILELFGLIARYGHVCQQYIIKQIFVQTPICKVILGLFDVYLKDCFNGNRRSLKISKFGGI